MHHTMPSTPPPTTPTRRSARLSASQSQTQSQSQSQSQSVLLDAVDAATSTPQKQKKRFRSTAKCDSKKKSRAGNEATAANKVELVEIDIGINTVVASGNSTKRITVTPKNASPMATKMTVKMRDTDPDTVSTGTEELAAVDVDVDDEKLIKVENAAIEVIDGDIKAEMDISSPTCPSVPGKEAEKGTSDGPDVSDPIPSDINVAPTTQQAPSSKANINVTSSLIHDMISTIHNDTDIQNSINIDEDLLLSESEPECETKEVKEVDSSKDAKASTCDFGAQTDVSFLNGVREAEAGIKAAEEEKAKLKQQNAELWSELCLAREIMHADGNTKAARTLNESQQLMKSLCDEAAMINNELLKALRHRQWHPPKGFFSEERLHRAAPKIIPNPIPNTTT